MELREAINKLFEMTDEQRLEVFNTSKVKEVLDGNYTKDIIKRMEDFCAEPKYGDMYANKTDSEDKCVFLGEDLDDSYWLLFDEISLPQEYSKSNFERNYTKTGRNVENKLNGLFK